MAKNKYNSPEISILHERVLFISRKNTWWIFFCAIITVMCTVSSWGQPLSRETAERFCHALITHSPELQKYILPEELSRCNRLGITYEGNPFKFLISNDIDSTLCNVLFANPNNYSLHITPLEDDYYSLTIEIPAKGESREYFFKDSLLVSKPYYYARNWKILHGTYFDMYISDTTLIHSAAIKELDAFVESTAVALNYSKDDLRQLKENRIMYYLCRNDTEIKQLTGFVTRGMYLIPYDYVISTYSCHLHELAHLLINYKIRHLKLFTRPFLQEGFAVAVGGRGGLDARVVLNSGLYLQKSGFLDFTEILSSRAFLAQDASVTYPGSGLYVKFLLSRGADSFLNLYKKYSYNGSLDDCEIDTSALPSRAELQTYLASYPENCGITLGGTPGKNAKRVFAEDGNEVYESPEGAFYRVRDTLMIHEKNPPHNYRSKLFEQIFPARKYAGEHFAVCASDNEISVYDFYTNNLVRQYSAGFSLNPQKVPKNNGTYEFGISGK